MNLLPDIFQQAAARIAARRARCAGIDVEVDVSTPGRTPRGRVPG
jgi:hypothetical protein